MTTREKIAHLHRRFGLGATKPELDRLEPLGVEAALDELLNFEGVDEGFPVSPWEFCFEPNMPDVYLEPPRIAQWWALRLLMTRRPLQEKLTLFWHNHFAVSAVKVEFGPAMLTYIETLRKYGAGDFGTLLKAVSQEPAMIRWLDTDANTITKPNENFAREVMELFTLGIGHYTEHDVHEAARAFTGWGNRYLVFEGGAEKVQESARAAIASGEPMVAFCITPGLQDSGPKTILGETGSFDGEAVLAMLAKRPETARRISKKLWEFFAYANPETSIIDRLAQQFTASNGNIKAMLRAIAGMPEFWSERCVRTQVKSPIDFTVAIARQFGLEPILLGMRPASSKPTTPLVKSLRDAAGLVFGTSYQQGMLLLYPPDVGGWPSGTAWITATNMVQRMRLADLIFGVGQKDKPLAAFLAAKIRTAYNPANSQQLADALLSVFDAGLPAEKRAVIISACEKLGGVAALGDPDRASTLFAGTCRLIFGAPEFQFC